MSIVLKQSAGGMVRPIDDARLYNFILSGLTGIAEGCEVTHIASNQLQISAGWGVCQGRMFEIEQEIINATVSPEGSKNGRLLIHIDVSAEKPAQFVTQVADVLPALVEENINENGTVFELELATYAINEIAITDFNQTFKPIMSPAPADNGMYTYIHSAGSLVGSGSNGKFKAAVSETITTIMLNGVSYPVLCAGEREMELAAGNWYTFVFDGEAVNFRGGGGLTKSKLALATAETADVLAGKKFYSGDKVLKTGTMADKSGTTQSATASLDTANSRVQMDIPATGKYSTASKLYSAYATVRNLIELTADKLMKGNTVLGLAGTGTDLNFTVVGGTSQPSNPAANTIWVNTSTAITDYVFSATQPSGATGRVWIKTGLTSNQSFNALKKNTITIYPNACYQWNGSSWVYKSSYVYINGWKEIKGVVIFVDSTGIHLTEMGNNMTLRNYSSYTETSKRLVLSGSAGGSPAHATAYAANKVNLSGKTTITITMMGNSAYFPIAFGVHTNNTTDWNNIPTKNAPYGTSQLGGANNNITTLKTYTYDVTNFEGEYYLFVGGMRNSNAGSIVTISNWKVE